MELDFDKEIDALLRKARERTEAAAAATDLAHLDADEIAAFAENALPEKTRQVYIKHFAACDRCRKILSQSILLEAEAKHMAAASTEIAAPVIPRSTWHQRLFGMPTVAYTMGALVLLFSGFLGIAVWQNMNSGQSAEVSQIEQKETYGTAANANAVTANTASAANAATNAVNAAAAATPAPPVSGNGPLSAANTVSNSTAQQPLGRNQAVPETSDQPKILEQRAESKPAAPAVAAPPAPLPKVADNEDMRSADKLAAAKDDAVRRDAEKQREVGEAMKKEAPVTAMRSMNNLPLNGRKTTPMMEGTSGYSATRTVNGRTFTKKDGVWYDADYHGQSTTNVRRGTDAYKKLDGGIRSIANALSGTVVTVWKAKAYRIQ